MTGSEDHRAVLAAIPPATRAALTARADAPGLARLALHLGTLGLGGAWITLGWPLWWAILPLHGVVLVLLFTLAHEATHQTPFARPWLSEAAGHLAGVLLLLPFRWFRLFHLAHHRWTNLPGQDPELDTPPPATRRALLWRLTGLPYWGAQARLLLRLAAGRERARYLPEAALPALAREARAYLALYALAAASLVLSPLLLWLWAIPALLGQPVLRLYLLAEHGDCPQVAGMFDNTRTTFTSRLVRLYAWNMPYHTEHHVWPQVPFHRLPEAHRLLRGHLRVTAPGYRAFARAYLGRRLRAGRGTDGMPT